MSVNVDRYKETVTEEQKQIIKSSIDFSEEKFYRFKFGWRMIFPELSEEEIDNLTWHSFIY